MITRLAMQDVKSYLLSLNAVKYYYDKTEFDKRCNFVYKKCVYYGYLSYRQVIDMFENC